MSSYTTPNGVHIEDLRKVMNVCETTGVKYIDIRATQMEGARTFQELVEKTGACGECDGCTTHIPWISKFICRCNQVSIDTILEERTKGAATQEEIQERTKAGSSCGRCKALTASILENGK
ncbi:MAG: (2Fe-2S)-binding protein [Defluviitaleaceae bacterium]|nr:(2Fe-2S)-binding protein [Defluviitaleaceae bacterium]